MTYYQETSETSAPVKKLTVRDLLNELEEYLARNDLDDGEIQVQDVDGTYQSPVLSLESAGDAWLIVQYPHDDCDAETALPGFWSYLAQRIVRWLSLRRS